MSIFITKSASKYINYHINLNKKCIGLRISIKKSGCNGLSYDFNYIYKKKKFDNIFKFKNISIFVSNKNLKYIYGLELDIISDGLNKKLKFNNPNAKYTCGCGKSFSI